MAKKKVLTISVSRYRYVTMKMIRVIIHILIMLNIWVHVKQFDYGLKYQEYFGGCILFTKDTMKK